MAERGRALRRRWRATGGTRTARRRCSTSSTRCGSPTSATGSTSIGISTNARFGRSAGKSALDVGCGAGLLAEPLARLGAKVTAIDAAPELIAAARAHAAGAGLAIDYRAIGVEALDGQYDLVTSMEVIEHVADPHAFVAVARRAARARRPADPLDPQPHRLVAAADHHARRRVWAIPKGTHDYDAFITPDQMTAMLAEVGLAVEDIEGIAMSPMRGLHLSEDVRLNYLVAARQG